MTHEKFFSKRVIRTGPEEKAQGFTSFLSKRHNLSILETDFVQPSFLLF